MLIRFICTERTDNKRPEGFQGVDVVEDTTINLRTYQGHVVWKFCAVSSFRTISRGIGAQDGCQVNPAQSTHRIYGALYKAPARLYSIHTNPTVQMRLKVAAERNVVCLNRQL